MNDTDKTKVQLIAEVNELRQRIAELKTSEVLLVQQHDMLRTLIDALPDYLYVKDTEGRFILSNVAHAQLRGVATPEALIGRSDFDFYPHALAEKFQAAERAILRGGPPLLNDEEPNVDAAGQPRWTLTTKCPLHDRHGRIVGTFGITRDITERKQLEAALRDSEQRYQEIFEASPDAIYLLEVLEDGQHFRNLDVNPAFEKMTGTVRAELIGKTMEETSSAEVAQTVNAKYRQCVAARTTCEEEVELNLPLGRLIFRSTLVPILDATKQVRRIIGITRDITARRRADEALRASERRERERAAELQTIMDTAPAAIWIAHDQMCQVITGNQAAYELLHLPPGSNASLTAPAGQRPTTYKMYQDGLELPPTELPVQIAAATGVEIREFECDNVLDDGTVIHMLGNAMPLYDEQGQPRGAVGAFIDITERRRIEIAEHEQRMMAETLREIATILNSTLNLDEVLNRILTSIGYFVPYEAVNLMLIDAQTRVAQVAGFQGYLQPEQEVFLRSVQFPIDATPNLHSMFEAGQSLVIADTHHSDLWLRLPGTDWIASYVGVPIRVKGKVIGFINLDSTTAGFYTTAHAERLQVFSDQAAVAIENARLYETIRHHAEELEQRVAERTRELSNANERLTELDRLKDDFISRISHELRTPLANLKLYLGLLETGRKPEKQTVYVQTLKRETDRLHRLIEELLKISQLDTETHTVSCIPIDLNQVATDLITAHLSLAAQRDLKLTSELEPNLPCALADAESVKQIMLNLMSNALGYTRQGTVTISTRRQVRGAEVWVTIAVRDTGPGLTADDRTHLFERFYRGHAARDYKTPGAGLGLSISRQLVTKLGGRITVESEEGQGSTFTVWLKPA